MNYCKKVVPLRKYNVVIPKLFNLITNMSNAQQVRLLKKAEELLSKESCVFK
jgi:hypothetical protein